MESKKKKANVVLYSVSNFKFNNYQNCFGVFRPRSGKRKKKLKTSLGERRAKRVMKKNKKQKERSVDILFFTIQINRRELR